MHPRTKPFTELPDGWLPHRTSKKLKFEPPFDWHAMLGYLTPRAIPGVEVVTDDSYARTLSTGYVSGLLRVTAGSKNELAVELATSEEVETSGLARTLRRLFDLDADPVGIARHFSKDKLIGPLVHKRPGIRIPRCWDPFELTIRVILGQQVSVAGATTLTGRVVRLHGKPLFEEAGIPGLSHAFPNPQALARTDLAVPVGLPRTRARSISGLAAAVASDPALLGGQGKLDEVIERLVALPGIGPWTANYVAMRGLRKDDAFPESDLGLLRSATKPDCERLKPAELLRLAEKWRPLRGYAAMHLWLSEMT
jgi:AraC family transcriptional regulator, regulatory protein of adaptative response / DNA-3-methyladenine glycosylase II